MAVWTERSLFYHIPKTGGTWVKEAMRHAGIRYHNCLHRPRNHPTMGLARAHATPMQTNDRDKQRFSFCFVRQPLAWYRSFWTYRAMHRKPGEHYDEVFPPDALWSFNPEHFVLNVLDAYPGGFVTELYQCYVDACDFVGRQENLDRDLILALSLAGETFDAEVILREPRQNLAAARPEWAGKFRISEATAARVDRAEQWVTETYYRSEQECQP